MSKDARTILEVCENALANMGAHIVETDDETYIIMTVNGNYYNLSLCEANDN